jgi:hypothetical protein
MGRFFTGTFPNNVITKADPKATLVDLDLAMELDSVPSGASHRTGTVQFIAIEVLQDKGHLSVRSRTIFQCLHMDMHSI